ncbi:fungal-specific transcription factor [Cadophora sp. MPI-SDFR-AT-0126]|nr:fungal-specific transcription factor [Leotiomycetes sp. MPI-SDFR-AT-0126]
MRTSTACVACRSRRKRCIFLARDIVCTHCREKQLDCTGPRLGSQLIPRNDITTLTAVVQKSNPPVSNLLRLPTPIVLEIVELYFDLIHDQFHTLFHRPSFTESVAKGTAPPVILYAMLALSARFSTNLAFEEHCYWDRGSGFAKESARLLDIRDVSLSTIQACILLGTVSRSEGDAAAESVYYSVANRMANLLDLANVPANNAVEKEVNVRVWWTTWKLDTWSSAGVGLPRQMVEKNDVPLPIEEGHFLGLRMENKLETEIGLPSDRNLSLFTQMIILNRILIEINDFHKFLTSITGSPINLDHHEQTILHLSHKLESWQSSLPPQMQNTPENLRLYGSQGLGRVFVAVHLGYYHFGQLLFYQYLQECQHSPSNESIVRCYTKKCKSFSSALCSLVDEAHRTPGCNVLYTMVGHNLVVASTVQIHTLLFSGSEIEIVEARKHLEKNFELLLQLRNFWPVLEISFEAFRTFREACRRNMDTAFKMDAWMLRFLYGFANKVEDKQVYETAAGGAWPVENIGFSPSEWMD